MSKWEKLLTRLKLLSADIRFEELKKILEAYGYVMRETGGGSSHVTFRKPGCEPITVPRHTPIKKVYIEMVKAVIEKEESNEGS